MCQAYSGSVLTGRSFFLDIAFQAPIECLTRHLTREHEAYFNLAVRPYQRRVHNAETLRHEGKPRAQVRETVGRVIMDMRQGERCKRGVFHGVGVRVMFETMTVVFGWRTLAS
jgi:hypothetical protein